MNTTTPISSELVPSIYIFQAKICHILTTPIIAIKRKAILKDIFRTASRNLEPPFKNMMTLLMTASIIIYPETPSLTSYLVSCNLWLIRNWECYLPLIRNIWITHDIVEYIECMGTQKFCQVICSLGHVVFILILFWCCDNNLNLSSGIYLQYIRKYQQFEIIWNMLNSAIKRNKGV